MSNNKLNIGLLTTELDDPYASSVCKGAISASKEMDTNLFIFPGRYIEADYNDKDRCRYDYQWNTLFEYPNVNNMDALIIMVGSIATTLTKERQLEFLKKYDGIPTVLIGTELEGYSSVLFDNRTGLKEVIEHMIKKHGVRNIGFVSGPVSSEDALERLDVYKETLEENGIEYDETKVAYGNFSEYSEKVCDELLDRHPDIKAIACANDQMAIGLYKSIIKRGLQIGKDILVTGFDNAPCCTSLIPNLTTVKADAVELGYKSLIKVLELIDHPGIEVHAHIETSMVKRNSCGCNGFTLDDIKEYSNIDIETTDVMEDISKVLADYVFYMYDGSDVVERPRQKFVNFIEDVIETFRKGQLNNLAQTTLSCEFAFLMANEIGRYVSNDTIYNALDVLEQKMYFETDDPDDKYAISTFIGLLYRRMGSESVSAGKKRITEINVLNDQINRITQDMLMYNHDDTAIYGTVVDKLSRLYMDSSYIYTFETPVSHYQEESWIIPEHIELKGYHDGETVKSLSVSRQRMSTKNLFGHRYLPQDRRYTMVVLCLYSGLEHYGMLMLEVEPEYFNFILPITNQLFAAIKIIHLLKDRADAQQRLQATLDQIQQSNALLDVMSKSDELTGILNRRGFLSKAKEIMESVELQGRKALAIYADMDNLKIINDKYGHDDGDFALKMIADSLKGAFRLSDVVARMGGDEYAIIAMVGEDDDIAQVIDERVHKILHKKNMADDKEYYVGLSLGFYEFTIASDVDVLSVMDMADQNLYEVKKSKVKIMLKSDLPDGGANK